MKCGAKLIFLILCCLSKLSVFAQDQKSLDSLLHLLNPSRQDSHQLKINRAIGDIYLYSNSNLAIKYFEEALKLATVSNRKLDMASNLYSIGYSYLNLANYEKSLDNYFKSVRLYEELNDKRRLANAYLSIMNVYTANKQFTKSEAYYELAKKLIIERKDSSQLNTLLAQKSSIFYAQELYDSSLVYLKRALQISRLTQDQYMTASLLGNIGLMYKKLGRYDEAFIYCDSSRMALNKLEGVNDYLAQLYNNVGAIELQRSNKLAAKKAFDYSIQLCKQGGFKSLEMENYRNLSEMYSMSKDLDSELFYLKLYHSMKDSLFNSDTKSQLNQLESDYKLEKSNNEIIKKDAKLKQEQSQKKIFIIVLIAFLVLLSALLYFYQRIQRKKELLETKNALIHEQKAELERVNHVKDRLLSIISHDLRNPLITLRSFLSLSDNHQLSEEKKNEFKGLTVQALAQTSEMLDNLLTWASMQLKDNTISLTPVSVLHCIHDMVSFSQSQAAQKNIQIHFNIPNPELANDEFMVVADSNLLSIALRNLLTNAIKFSKEGQTIQIALDKINHEIIIGIHDQGIGMSTDQLQFIETQQNQSSTGTKGEKGSGLGLFLVNELLQKMNATLKIKSTLGEGCSCIISFHEM